MAEMRTEEEQVEAIKNWWKKNGASLVIGIVVALAIVFGWQSWQSHQAQERSEAAAQFAGLLNALDDQDSEERNGTINYVAGQLQENHEDSAYAVYGTLILAQQQMLGKEDPTAAVESLRWALERVEKGGPVEPVVRHRLAQAQFAAGDRDEALATIRDASGAETFVALFAELEGDILLADGDKEGARNAYRAARSALGEERNGLLELKMADLAIGEEA
ncbi:YfgM family protein [Marinobacter sp.]|uniref:YfgM family protein n=1 Tax=Marinobacter sp. TaxID=50741 RepID=UPI00384B3B65